MSLFRTLLPSLAASSRKVTLLSIIRSFYSPSFSNHCSQQSRGHFTHPFHLYPLQSKVVRSLYCLSVSNYQVILLTFRL